MSEFRPDCPSIDGSPYRIAIVCARFNPDVVEPLLQRCLETLKAYGVKEENVEVMRVPGSNEVPWGIQVSAESGRFDACVGLGVLLQGATLHFEVVAKSCSDAMQMIALNSFTPVINGVVVAGSLEEAKERTIGELDRGSEFAEAALQMAALKSKYVATDES